MVASKLKSDLKKLAQLKSVDELKKQLVTYEKRVLEVVREVDLKTQHARRLGEAQVAKFKTQVREQRTLIEKQVRELVSKERERLSDNINDLVAQLRKLSGNEVAQTVPTPTKKTAKAGTTKKAAPKKRAAGPTAKRKTSQIKLNEAGATAAPN